MSQRHPLVILAACWLVVGLLFVAADCLLKPTPNPTPAPATRRPAVTVLPTVYVFSTATLVPAPTLDMLPSRVPSTRVPTQTSTPTPTETPVPPMPSQRATQKG